MKTSVAVLLICVAGASLPAAAGPDKLGSAVSRSQNVHMPEGALNFPRGEGSDLANAQCVICHSVGMVTRQPPLSFDEWKAEVAKMRAVYGAPLSADQIEPIARYLTTINGKP